MIIAGLGIIIPYDFDYSGLVNADYAVPMKDWELTKSHNAVYLGICRPEENYVKALKEFSEKKTEFYKVINEFQYLSDKEKKGMIRLS